MKSVIVFAVVLAYMGFSSPCLPASAPGVQKSSLVRSADVASVLDELPLAIKLRVSIAKHTSCEYGIDPLKDTNYDASPISFLQYYICSDGVEFLVDNSQMALWYRKTNESPWKCVISNVHIVKTMGGDARYLPVQYAGRERFLVTESLYLPRRMEGSVFPVSDCVTYLINAATGNMIARTQKVEYDHNPKIMIPDNWVKKYNLVVEQ